MMCFLGFMILGTLVAAVWSLVRIWSFQDNLKFIFVNVDFNTFNFLYMIAFYHLFRMFRAGMAFDKLQERNINDLKKQKFYVKTKILVVTGLFNFFICLFNIVFRKNSKNFCCAS